MADQDGGETRDGRPAGGDADELLKSERERRLFLELLAVAQKDTQIEFSTISPHLFPAKFIAPAKAKQGWVSSSPSVRNGFSPFCLYFHSNYIYTLFRSTPTQSALTSIRLCRSKRM
jgi:hypothetical protein